MTPCESNLCSRIGQLQHHVTPCDTYTKRLESHYVAELDKNTGKLYDPPILFIYTLQCSLFLSVRLFDYFLSKGWCMMKRKQ